MNNNIVIHVTIVLLVLLLIYTIKPLVTRKKLVRENFFKFGSQKSEQKSITDIVNSNVTNIVNSKTVENNTSITVSADQKVSIEGIRCKRGSIAVNQLVGITLKKVGDFQSQDAQNIKDAILADIDKEQKSAAAIETEDGWGIGITNQETKNEVINTVRNIVSTNVTNENIVSTVTNLNIDADQTIYMKDIIVDEDCDININQNLLVDAVIKKVTKMFTDAIIENEKLTEIRERQVTEQKAKLTGIATLVDSVFDGLQGMYGVCAIMVLGIVCIVCAVVLGGGSFGTIGSMFGEEDSKGKTGAMAGLAGSLICCISCCCCCSCILGMDYQFNSNTKNSIIARTYIDVPASDEIEAVCGEEWYNEDAQKVLTDTYNIKQNASDANDADRQTADYFRNMFEGYLCNGTDDKKVTAYNNLYQCLAVNNFVKEGEMATTNVFTGCTADDYKGNKCTNEDISSYLSQECTSLPCNDCSKYT